MRLLLAEDTVDLSRAEVAVLSHEGYDVDPAYDGEQALEMIQAGAYDGVILDIMMPKKDGLEVLTEMRKRGITSPVLLLTAKAEVDDRVTGLDLGADDYLTKPFAMKELLARVRSMTRRKTDYSAKELSIGDVRLNSDSFELVSENTVRLSIKEFELMQALILNSDRPLATDYLISRIWATEPDANADTVWLYISYLRNKLESIDSRVRITGERGGSFTLTA
jgi:DNA-binding response OmpR family regulator